MCTTERTRKVLITWGPPDLLEDSDGTPLGLEIPPAHEWEHDTETGAYTRWLTNEEKGTAR